MDRFRILLVIIISLLAFHLFYKLLQHKRDLIEGATDFTSDMNDMRNLHNPEIQLPSYKILKVADRPSNLSEKLQNEYKANKERLTKLEKDLNDVQRKMKQYTGLKMPTKKSMRELNMPSGNRRNNKAWSDYDDRVRADNTRYTNEMGTYRVKKNEYTTLQDDEASIKTDIRNIKADISRYDCTVAGKQSEFDKYNDDNDSSAYRNYRLKDLFIKASYNSAFTGKTMNSSMIELVLKRGCRYIDFEVTKKDDTLYVSDMRLIDMLGVINKSLIGTDPLFINLRLASEDITPKDLKGIIPTELVYKGRKIDETTRISEIAGKCIIITDRDIGGSDMISDCKHDEMCAYRYSEISSFQSYTESSKLTVVNPDDTRNGVLGYLLGPDDVDTQYLIANYLANVIPFRFYKKTAEFELYERIFNDMNCTIVPMKNLSASELEKISTAVDKI